MKAREVEALAADLPGTVIPGFRAVMTSVKSVYADVSDSDAIVPVSRLPSPGQQ